MTLSVDDKYEEQFESCKLQTTDCSFEGIATAAEANTAEVVDDDESVTFDDEADDLNFGREFIHSSFEDIPNPAELDTAEVVENAKSVTEDVETDDLTFRREVLL